MKALIVLLFLYSVLGFFISNENFSLLITKNKTWTRHQFDWICPVIFRIRNQGYVNPINAGKSCSFLKLRFYTINSVLVVILVVTMPFRLCFLMGIWQVYQLWLLRKNFVIILFLNMSSKCRLSRFLGQITNPLTWTSCMLMGLTHPIALLAWIFHFPSQHKMIHWGQFSHFFHWLFHIW